MYTTTFNRSDSAVIKSGPQGSAGGGVDFRNISRQGLRDDFEFDGAQLEVIASSFGAGTASAVIIVDGVPQPRLTLTTTPTWYTAWTGSEGTHSCSIYADNGGTTSYTIMPNTGGIRITGTAPAIRRLAGFGANLTIIGNQSYFSSNARNFENSGGSSQFRLPAEGMRFKTVANAPGWTGELKLYVTGFNNESWWKFTVDGVEQTTVVETGNSGKMGYFVGITVDPTVAHEIEFQNTYDGTGAGYSGVSTWGIMFVGATNHAINTSPGFTPLDIALFEGDSITQYVNTTNKDGAKAFANIVPKRLGMGGANAGVSGRNLVGMSTTVAASITTMRASPKKIIAMGGRNDRFQGVATATSQANMASWFSNARSGAAGAQLIWLQMLGSTNPADTAADATLQAALASQFASSVGGGLTNAKFISDANTWVPYTGTYFQDSVHLNELGQATYANRLIPVVADISYTISGPVSNTYTVTLAGSATFDGQCTITLTTDNAATIDATAVGGSISGDNTTAVTVTPAAGQTSFTFAPSASTTITPTNGQSGWTNPSNVVVVLDDESSSSSSSLSSASSASSNSSSSPSSPSSASSASSNSSSSPSSASSASSNSSVSELSSASSNSSSSSSTHSSASSASSQSSSSSSSVDQDMPKLDAIPVHNSFPSIFINDDDPGIVSKIDEIAFKYNNVPTLRGPVTVEIESPFRNSEIRYTLNGKNPTPTSHKYVGPLVFRQNASGEKTAVKARIYDRTNANMKSKIIRLEFRIIPPR